MTSNLNDLNEINSIGEIGESTENLEQLQEAARGELVRSYTTINNGIDGLSSANLKRVLKFLVGAGDVHHLITGKEFELSDNEKALLDDLFGFSRTCLGFFALLKETNEENELTSTTEETENE